MSNAPRYNLTGVQQFFFVLLRIGIGWHFLREGIVKLANPTWSAVGYLTGSWGPFSPIYHYIAQTPWMLDVSNFMMPWSLTFVGLGLMLGVFTRLSILGAIGLLAMFYTAAPAIEAMPYLDTWGKAVLDYRGGFLFSVDHAQWAGQHMLNCEGNYMIVNKNLIEMLALFALLTVDSGMSCGFDVYIRKWFSKGSSTPTEPDSCCCESKA